MNADPCSARSLHLKAALLLQHLAVEDVRQRLAVALPGLVRHGFSPTRAMERGINTTSKARDLHLRKGDTVVQQPGDRGLRSFKVELDARNAQPRHRQYAPWPSQPK